MGPEQNNEFAGVGGSYTVGRDGVRTRVEETTDHPEGNRPRDPDGKPLVDAPSTEDRPSMPAAPALKPWQTAPEEPAPRPRSSRATLASVAPAADTDTNKGS